MQNKQIKSIRTPKLFIPLSFVLFLLTYLYPVNSFISRTLFLISFLALWLSPWISGIKSKTLMTVQILFSLIVMGFYFVPNFDEDLDFLKKSYLNNLKSFEKTRYVWGGANFVGIDCSGLPRKAYIKALFKNGFSKFESTCIRDSIELWWYDSSAKALKENYRSYTETVEQNISIKNYDTEIGDLAITSDGVHVIIYLGEHQWIHADPYAGNVIIEDSRTSKNIWFRQTFDVVRWSLFCE